MRPVWYALVNASKATNVTAASCCLPCANCIVFLLMHLCICVALSVFCHSSFIRMYIAFHMLVITCFYFLYVWIYISYVCVFRMCSLCVFCSVQKVNLLRFYLTVILLYVHIDEITCSGGKLEGPLTFYLTRGRLRQ